MLNNKKLGRTLFAIIYHERVLSDRLCSHPHDSGNVWMPELHPLSNLIHCLRSHSISQSSQAQQLICIITLRCVSCNVVGCA